LFPTQETQHSHCSFLHRINQCFLFGNLPSSPSATRNNMASTNVLIRGFCAFRAWYNKLLDTNYTATQIGTAGTLYCVGDVICQTVEGKEHFDYARVARMTGMGVVLMGFAGSKWYHFIDKLLPATNTATIVKKVALDQFVFAPTFYLTFYSGMSLLEGHTVSYTAEHIKKKFLPTYLADLTFWPAAQAFNFKMVTPPNRVLYISTLCIPWNAFLSHLQHNDVQFSLPAFLKSSKSAPAITSTPHTTTHTSNTKQSEVPTPSVHSKAQCSSR